MGSDSFEALSAAQDNPSVNVSLVELLDITPLSFLQYPYFCTSIVFIIYLFIPDRT